MNVTPLSQAELLDVAIQLVELYFECSQIHPDMLRYLKFSDANKTKYRNQIFEVVMDQIVFVHDHVTTPYDWTQLGNRLLISSMESPLQKQQLLTQGLFQVFLSYLVTDFHVLAAWLQ